MGGEKGYPEHYHLLPRLKDLGTAALNLFRIRSTPRMEADHYIEAPRVLRNPIRDDFEHEVGHCIMEGCMSSEAALLALDWQEKHPND